MASPKAASKTLARAWRQEPQNERLTLAYAEDLMRDEKTAEALKVLEIAMESDAHKATPASDRILWARASLLLKFERFSEASRIAASLRDTTARAQLHSALDAAELQHLESVGIPDPPQWLVAYEVRIGKMLGHLPLRPVMTARVWAAAAALRRPHPSGERAARACVAAAVTSVIAAYGLPYPLADAILPFGVTQKEATAWKKRFP
jgi:hypothetical protein